ncbi:MAG: anaerobic ribonucleoside-triphosphate reductase activating protein [Lachnospiraceae bacterium]|nr:anaerobic ribonucleoside-triphosphate reductase activating protein [Lachnospiraceae bacterium]
MKICGFQKTTLLDYPGHLAASIFTGGCNFRCPFCHNSELLPGDVPAAFPEEEVLAYLQKRRHILEGVCITGGEPTLQPDLETFLRKIRALGYRIKLDTNGYQPQVLETLLAEKLVDYAAMDIKNSPGRYGETVGIRNLSLRPIEESIALLKRSEIPWEFRTTVVRELHQAEDFKEIGPWISGAPAYFLQNYVDSRQVLCPGFTSYSKSELLTFLELVRPFVKTAALRGID